MKNHKSKALYSLMTLFIVGGLYVASAQKVFAAAVPLSSYTVTDDGVHYNITATFPASTNDEVMYYDMGIWSGSSSGFQGSNSGSNCTSFTGGICTVVLPINKSYYSSSPDGFFIICVPSAHCNSPFPDGADYYGQFLISSSTIQGSNYLATGTRMIAVSSPANLATGISNTVTFSGSYIMTGVDIHGTNDVGAGAFHPYIHIVGQSSQSTSTFEMNVPVTSFDSIQTFSTTTTVNNNDRFKWDASFVCFNSTWFWYNCGANASLNLSNGFGFLQFTTGLFDPTNGKSFDLSMCNPFSGFSASDCVHNLIIPNELALATDYNDSATAVSTLPPWGYLARIVELVATTSTTTMPTLAYTFQSDSPLSGKTLSFDVGSYMTASAALSNEAVSNTDHKTVWQIFEPLVELFIYLMLAFAMLHDLSGIKLTHHQR